MSQIVIRNKACACLGRCHVAEIGRLRRRAGYYLGRIISFACVRFGMLSCLLSLMPTFSTLCYGGSTEKNDFGVEGFNVSVTNSSDGSVWSTSLHVPFSLFPAEFFTNQSDAEPRPAQTSSSVAMPAPALVVTSSPWPLWRLNLYVAVVRISGLLLCRSGFVVLFFFLCIVKYG